MISRTATRLLRWLARQDKWLRWYEIEDSCPFADSRAFSALEKKRFVDAMDFDTDRRADEPHLLYYRISDYGIWYLENAVYDRWREIRNWVTLAIALAAFIKSFWG